MSPLPHWSSLAAIEPITHSTRFALVDGRGRIRGYYDGTAMETVSQLSNDVGNLLSERD